MLSGQCLWGGWLVEAQQCPLAVAGIARHFHTVVTGDVKLMSARYHPLSLTCFPYLVCRDVCCYQKNTVR